ncbi:hypothetical protein KAI87_04950, partial [Myxococcota bacterium]|nr:hypothetical protein [Myxococcota bacterium]
EHKENGIILVAGPNIKSGKISPRTQYDIAPTVLHLMGLPVPQEMPGKVAMSLFPETYAANHKPVYSDVPVDRPSASRKKKKAKKKKANTHFEDTEIERLRSLGYVQ